jgi:hypothetical protein
MSKTDRTNENVMKVSKFSILAGLGPSAGVSGFIKPNYLPSGLLSPCWSTSCQRSTTPKIIGGAFPGTICSILKTWTRPTNRRSFSLSQRPSILSLHVLSENLDTHEKQIISTTILMPL